MKTLDLNKASKVGLGVALAFVLLGFAGTADRTEQIIYNMPDSTYQEIKSKLSAHDNEPTDYAIATFYVKHYGK